MSLIVFHKSYIAFFFFLCYTENKVMQMEYLERVNKAFPDYPYIDLKKTNFSYGAHYHEEIEVIYMISGHTTLTLDSVSHTLYAGDIFLVMPGEIHSFFSDTANDLYVMKLYCREEMSLYRLDGKISKKDAAYPAFKKIIDAIAFEDTEKNIGYTYAVGMHVNHLLLNIFRLLSPRKILPAEQKETVRRLAFLNAVQTYLDAHYAEKITLESAARALNYSKYYFSHLFKEITNQSFMDFVTEFRLEKSIALLMVGQSVSEAALSVGFSNLRTYNRVFKAHYKTTPSAYKNGKTVRGNFP